jgi:hypothetical protein
LKLTLTDAQVEHLLFEAQENAKTGSGSYRTAWSAIERQCRSALAYGAKRGSGGLEWSPEQCTHHEVKAMFNEAAKLWTTRVHGCGLSLNKNGNPPFCARTCGHPGACKEKNDAEKIGRNKPA